MATLRGMRTKVGRALRNGGMPRAEWNPSGRVRGWGNWSPGYDYVAPGHFVDTANVPGVEVRYVFSTYGRDDYERKMEKLTQWQQRATEVLTAAGFRVELLSDGHLWVAERSS